MSAVWPVSRAAVRRRRLQTIVIGVVVAFVGLAYWLLFQRGGAASQDSVATNVRPGAGSK